MLDRRRKACLDAMGIDTWVLRPSPGSLQPALTESEAVSTVTATASVDEVARLAQASPEGRTPPAVPPPQKNGPEDSGGTTGDDDRSDYDPADLDSYYAATAATEMQSECLLPDDPASTMDWPALRAAVAGCERCTLHAARTQSVFGVGDVQAQLMIVGEAPGADEDRQGEPFVGRAGQLLNAMLEAIGLRREQVYIANIVKCRPPGNRDPQTDEAAACRSYLLRQIALIEPRLILAVGRVSAHNLLGTEEAVGRLRGRVHQFDPGNIPLLVTYHPAYLLRRPTEKAKAWDDLQAAHRLMREAAAG